MHMEQKELLSLLLGLLKAIDITVGLLTPDKEIANDSITKGS